jgi:hypothetical protein
VEEAQLDVNFAASVCTIAVRSDAFNGVSCAAKAENDNRVPNTSKIVSIVTLGFQKCNSAMLSFQPPIEYSIELIFQPLSARTICRCKKAEGK